MGKARIEVSAELLVSVRFPIEVEDSTTLIDTNTQARAAAERVAQAVVGLRGDHAGATVQRLTSFSTKSLG